VEMAPHWLPQIYVLRVPDDADNCGVQRSGRAYSLADRITIAEKIPGQFFVDDGYLWAVDGVLGTEITPGDQWNIKRLEIVRRDMRRVDVHLLVFTGRIAFDGNAGHVPTA